MLANMLNKTCTIEQLTVTKTSIGSAKKTYSTRASGVKCNVKVMTDSERDEHAKRTVIAIYRFYFEGTVTIDNSDRILFNSQYYAVQTVYNVSAKDRLLHVDCLLID
mgnify:CR=1 FL=1